LVPLAAYAIRRHRHAGEALVLDLGVEVDLEALVASARIGHTLGQHGLCATFVWATGIFAVGRTTVVIVLVTVVAFLPGIGDAIPALHTLSSYHQRVAVLSFTTWLRAGSNDAVAFIITRTIVAEVAALFPLLTGHPLALTQLIAAARGRHAPQVP